MGCRPPKWGRIVSAGHIGFILNVTCDFIVKMYLFNKKSSFVGILKQNLCVVGAGANRLDF